MPERTAELIYQAIQKAAHILLIPHQNPDGDSLGSVAAMMQYLRSIKKSAEIFCATPASSALLYLPHATDINTDVKIFEDSSIDLIMIFDAGDLRYAGVEAVLSAMKKRPPIVNIDHHLTNENYGEYNMVIPSASSTTEIVYRFFHANRIPLDKHMATSLLTGLITDTDHFTNAATSSASVHIASDLILRGGNIDEIKKTLLKNKTTNILKLWGLAFSRLEHNKETDITHTYLLKDDLVLYQVAESETEGIANFLNSLSEGKATLILKEREDGMVRGSFRTTRNDVDVSAFAKALGGGGHKKASGFTMEGPIETALGKIFSVIISS